MCLYANKEKRKGDKPSRRRYAWKVVRSDRSAVSIHTYTKKYRKGSVHVAPEKRILKKVRDGNFGPEYTYGLHVYKSRRAARRMVCWNHKIIKVQVGPTDWMADDADGEAVYTKLKVLT